MTVKNKIEMLRKMIRVRLFEEVVAKYKLENKIPGPVHTSIGEEAVDVGVCSALSSDDYIIGNFRSHGHLIAKGANLNLLMAEIFGKSTGLNGGRGGSMHVLDVSVGNIGTSAIVGSGLPVACGAAFSSKHKNDNRITCVFFGDGASNEGTFHECLNLASSWKLPVIFLLENNGYAITTPLADVSVTQDLYKRAKPFGVKGKQVDGQNVEDVYNCVKWAIKNIGAGNGPVLIESKTYRFNEHQEGAYYAKFADLGYRDKAEVNHWKNLKDPILLYRDKLKSENNITPDVVEAILVEEQLSVANAIEFAENSKIPTPEKAYGNVFIGGEER